MAGESLLEAYPLTWPEGQQRTPPHRRARGRFSATFVQARDEMLAELRRLGAAKAIVSTNIPLRRDGLPLADAREPEDPGVAVYFERNRTPFVIACDSYDKVKYNLRAVGLTVEALRAIERHGSTQMMEQAFQGFAALPPSRTADPSWWETLCVTRDADLDVIKASYHALAQQHHPDRGGDHERMARLNRAYEAAQQERK